MPDFVLGFDDLGWVGQQASKHPHSVVAFVTKIF